jgi:hypothetical protein
MHNNLKEEGAGAGLNNREARSLLRLLFYRHTTPQSFTAAALWGTVWGVVIFTEPQKFKFSEIPTGKNRIKSKGA